MPWCHIFRRNLLLASRSYSHVRGHQRRSFTVRRVADALPKVLNTTRTSNKQTSVDPASDQPVNRDFAEEPLGVTAEQGHGYLRVDFCEVIGPDGRYKVVRKLGWGVNSNVWMAFDQKAKRYVAIKALKGHATALYKKGMTWELPALKRLASITPPAGVEATHVPRLLDHFTHPGRDKDGEHLCLVTEVLGGDVRRLQSDVARGKPFPLPLAKRILLHTLHGLAHTHHCGFAHTDLRQENIMFDTGAAELTAFVEGVAPPVLHPPQESSGCTVQAAVSQPLPLPPLAGAVARTYLLSDFGHAQPSTVRIFDPITRPELRAPEMVLQGPCDEKVDIWAFGCLIFELVTARPLFILEPHAEYAFDDTAMHLWLMLSRTRERLTRAQVEASKLGTQYFDLPASPGDPFCNLKTSPRLYDSPFLAILQEYGGMEVEDERAMAAIMQRCLRLDPRERATARELLEDPWWTGAA
ncbi:kinase-like domain-containing protein [Lyophyllum atratum]|nr:kinase-like domain-containing protein [Lyophyllum atratum]